MNTRDDGLLPEIRRDRRVRAAVLGFDLLCAVMGAGMFGAGGTIDDHGWLQLVEDFGTALLEWPLMHLGYLAAMVVGLLWPSTPLVLLGFAGVFVTPMGACLIQSIRIT